MLTRSTSIVVPEIKADHLPLIPFGPAADKALAALSPEAADRLAALGIVSPRDPNNPKEPVTADWSLDVLHSWRLELPAGKTTPIIVKFTPIIGHYRVGKGDEQNIADLKDEVCLKPQVMTTLQSRLKGNGAWNVTEFRSQPTCQLTLSTARRLRFPSRDQNPTRSLPSAEWTTRPQAARLCLGPPPTAATNFGS